MEGGLLSGAGWLVIAPAVFVDRPCLSGINARLVRFEELLPLDGLSPPAPLLRTLRLVKPPKLLESGEPVRLFMR